MNKKRRAQSSQVDQLKEELDELYEKAGHRKSTEQSGEPDAAPSSDRLGLAMTAGCSGARATRTMAEQAAIYGLPASADSRADDIIETVMLVARKLRRFSES